MVVAELEKMEKMNGRYSIVAGKERECQERRKRRMKTYLDRRAGHRPH